MFSVASCYSAQKFPRSLKSKHMDHDELEQLVRDGQGDPHCHRRQIDRLASRRLVSPLPRSVGRKDCSSAAYPSPALGAQLSSATAPRMRPLQTL